MEEIKALEVEIDQAQADLEKSVRDVEVAQSKAAAARDVRNAQQGAVNDVATSTYRTMQVDSVVNTLGSQTPQEIIDKTTYLGSIARKRQEELDVLKLASRDAIDAARAADVAKAAAQYKRGKLEAQRARLEEERTAIEGRIKDVEAKVDALSPEARLAWMNQGNPVPADLLDPSAFAGGIVGAAMGQLGKPYGWGASGPDAFDCSGLMVWAYSQNGKSIPRTSQAQLAGGTPVPLNQLQPGDIVGYYPGVTHVGMYIGNGQVVHASDYGIPVQVVPLNSMPIQGAVRY
ncbi:hydrolase [Corynebacterium liangguodongii]|uniref:Hydrolase n=2 Tax=Corynebacterium liangguodongii TaxID=2079535 RepID=A0A2S0WH48_9CORY|nr:hydrolase [Corynebacterium liangguodongii]PWB99961.1 hydrolase [Corynebacterium liangguodongii]